MKNLIVGQSGGPTAVINSSLYGVIREGFNRSEEIEHVYGMINGIQGFLDGRFMDMKNWITIHWKLCVQLQGLTLVPAVSNFRMI